MGWLGVGTRGASAPAIGATGAAVGAEAVELHSVRVEDEAGPRFDVASDRADTQISDLRGSPAAGAHHVVMVARPADHVGMGAIGQVKALDEAEFLEQLECPEHGRPAYGQPPSPGLANQLTGGEMFVTIGEKLGNRPAGPGHQMAGPVEGVSPSLRVSHG